MCHSQVWDLLPLRHRQHANQQEADACRAHRVKEFVAGGWGLGRAGVSMRLVTGEREVSGNHMDVLNTIYMQQMQLQAKVGL